MEEREEKNGVDNSGNEIDPGDLRPRMTHPPDDPSIRHLERLR